MPHYWKQSSQNSVWGNSASEPTLKFLTTVWTAWWTWEEGCFHGSQGVMEISKLLSLGVFGGQHVCVWNMEIHFLGMDLLALSLEFTLQCLLSDNGLGVRAFLTTSTMWSLVSRGHPGVKLSVLWWVFCLLQFVPVAWLSWWVCIRTSSTFPSVHGNLENGQSQPRPGDHLPAALLTWIVGSPGLVPAGKPLISLTVCSHVDSLCPTEVWPNLLVNCGQILLGSIRLFLHFPEFCNHIIFKKVQMQPWMCCLLILS